MPHIQAVQNQSGMCNLIDETHHYLAYCQIYDHDKGDNVFDFVWRRNESRILKAQA